MKFEQKTTIKPHEMNGELNHEIHGLSRGQGKFPGFWNHGQALDLGMHRDQLINGLHHTENPDEIHFAQADQNDTWGRMYEDPINN